jgi:hypothetical protein
VQPDTGVLTISGTGLGSDLTVMVEGQPVTVLPGATDTQLEAVAPVMVLTTPGTYRLAVVDPTRQVGDGFVVASPAGRLVTVDGPTGGVAPGTGSSRPVGPVGEANRTSRGLNASTAPLVTENACLTAVGLFALASNPAGVCRNTAVGQEAMYRNTHGVSNTAVGFRALYDNSNGFNNTAIGDLALTLNTSGINNTASGAFALYRNRTGPENTAAGFEALYANSTGAFNTASGSQALRSNTTGDVNTAIGASALYSNSTGTDNTAVGAGTLSTNSSGMRNTASGNFALTWNSTGDDNTASGFHALASNTVGIQNTATGALALFSNTTGLYNVASGANSLAANTSGSYNTAHGVEALLNNTTGTRNTASGLWALLSSTTGDNNTAVGISAGANATTGSHNVYLGADVVGTAADANTMRLGLPFSGGAGQSRTFIAGIHGTQLTGPAVQVFVDANGQLGTLTPPVATGTISGGIGTFAQAEGEASATIVALRRQVEQLQVADAELRARLVKLEALLQASAAAPPRR